MRCAVSGSGNVAQYASQKLLELEAKVITISDSNGVLVFEDGMTSEDLKKVMDCKNVKRGRLLDLDGQVSGKYVAKQSPWTMDVKYDLAFPCATQNEIDEAGAKLLVKNGVLGVLEGANLPTNMQAQDVLRAKNVLYIPGKASNAGGVGVSGLEMSQNAQRLTWEAEEVDAKLQAMIASIYSQMESSEGSTLEEGANRAGFIKVATAMRELGWVQ
jgi:glutamate dehydrogenase (NADP+)